MSRPTKDEHFMDEAYLISRRGTCRRRKVGAILVNGLGHILSTGYNGPARGLPHCVDTPCAGVSFCSGEGLDECEAVHAEANALLQCRDVWQIEAIYCTTFPCMSCIKLLLSTSCARIVYAESYPHPKAQDLWVQTGRNILKLAKREITVVNMTS